MVNFKVLAKEQGKTLYCDDNMILNPIIVTWKRKKKNLINILCFQSCSCVSDEKSACNKRVVVTRNV